MLRVALVQGNIAQDRKWQPAVLEETLRRYVQLSLSEHGRTDVIVWPETAIPIFQDEVHAFLTALAENARRERRLRDRDSDRLVGNQRLPQQCDRHRSVARFLPETPLAAIRRISALRSFFLFFRDWVNIPMADFTPASAISRCCAPVGSRSGSPSASRPCSATRSACAAEATWLINVSNDAWFRGFHRPHQHLQIVRMRALEMGRYLARATNTGLSAILSTTVAES